MTSETRYLRRRAFSSRPHGRSRRIPIVPTLTVGKSRLGGVIADDARWVTGQVGDMSSETEHPGAALEAWRSELEREPHADGIARRVLVRVRPTQRSTTSSASRR